MAVMKRKAKEVTSVCAVEKKSKKCRRHVVAVKTNPNPTRFASGVTWRRHVGAVKSKPKPVSSGSGKWWVRGDKIGEGGFGAVFIAFTTYDLLRVPKTLAMKSAEMKHSGSIKHELHVYNDLEGEACPFLIQHYGYDVTMSSRDEEVYNLALEYGWGSLAKLIKESSGEGLPENEVREYTGQILEGLKHMHDGGYVHCDLKPDNVLLVGGKVKVNGRLMLMAKVGDLGLAKREEEEEGGWRGTPSYLAPETVFESRQKKPSDIWGVGLVVLEMLTGRRPRQVWYEREIDCLCIVDGIIKPEIPDSLSEDAKEFIGLCLEELPEHRFTVEKLMSLPFVASLR